MKRPNITQGPWMDLDGSIGSEELDICICTIEDDGGYEAPPEQRKANAIAIAALPDVLAALENLIESYGGCECLPTEPEPHCFFCHGRAALTKAGYTF